VFLNPYLGSWQKSLVQVSLVLVEILMLDFTVDSGNFDTYLDLIDKFAADYNVDAEHYMVVENYTVVIVHCVDAEHYMVVENYTVVIVHYMDAEHYMVVENYTVVIVHIVDAEGIVNFDVGNVYFAENSEDIVECYYIVVYPFDFHIALDFIEDYFLVFILIGFVVVNFIHYFDYLIF